MIAGGRTRARTCLTTLLTSGDTRTTIAVKDVNELVQTVFSVHACSIRCCLWLCSRVSTADVRLTAQRVDGGVFDVHEK
jgi:hypothetical protein